MAIADTLTEVGQAGSITTLSAPGKAIGTFNINVGSTANWPATGKTVYFGMRTVNPSAVTTANPSGLVAGTYSEWKGIVGTNAITSMQLQAGSTDQTYTAGSNTQVFISVNAPRENALVQWGQVHADNQGNLLGPAVLTALGQTAQTGAGWQTLGTTLSAVTANGNRSYTATTSSDQTGVLSPGMRLLTTRTVAAPTQCTNLNGTNQSFSKTSPAGLSYTDTMSAGGWIKPAAYQVGGIISRFNGTNGWYLSVNASGQVILQFGTSTKSVLTYQSTTLNKWLHVVLTITGTTGTAYFDGTPVPFTLTGSGTLTQAGNLEVGSYNGANFFSGKIAQAFVSSVVLTPTQVKAIYSQGITTADTATYSMISAYSFNNSINDLNTTNANNLTANGSAVATNADSPFGSNGASATLDYGIITAVTSTQITFQVPEGSTVPTSGGVSTVSYSTQKTPYGFPGNMRSWALQSILGSVTSGATTGVFNNPGGFNVSCPAGSWDVVANCAYGAPASNDFNVGISTSPTSVTDFDCTSRIYMNAGGTVNLGSYRASKLYNFSAATSIYMVGKAIAAWDLRGDVSGPHCSYIEARFGLL